MNKHEIRAILENKSIDQVREFVIDVSRKLAPIYENEYGNKGLSFCMVIVSCEAEPFKKAAALFLNKIREDLIKHPKSTYDQINAINCMISATYAHLVQNEHEIMEYSIISLEHAFASSTSSPEITRKIDMCLRSWKANWQGYVGSQ